MTVAVTVGSYPASFAGSSAPAHANIIAFSIVSEPLLLLATSPITFLGNDVAVFAALTLLVG